MDIGDKEVKACQDLPALPQPELVGSLYGVDGSLPRGRKTDNLCFRGLSLENIGGKVARIGRVACRTKNLAAAGLNDVGRVLFNRMPPAKSIVTKYQLSNFILTRVEAVPFASA